MQMLLDKGAEPCTLHPAPCTLNPTPYALHPTPYTLHPTPFALHLTPYPLHPTPYTLNPTPYTIHPTPYSLHPTPYTLHPTPYTLHPTPYTLGADVNTQMGAPRSGWTPLLHALSSSRESVVQLLLDHGADANLKVLWCFGLHPHRCCRYPKPERKHGLSSE